MKEIFTKKELQEMLLEVIGIYKKLQYSNSHEYFAESDAILKVFTNSDARRMEEIINKVQEK